MSHYVMYSKFGVFCVKQCFAAAQKIEVFVPSMLCQAFGVKTSMHQPREVVGVSSRFGNFQQNSRESNSACKLDVYCILRTDVQWISNLSFFSATLDLLTKKNLESQLHASTFGLRKYPHPRNLPWRYRSLKHLCLVVPVASGRRSPEWSREITVTMSRTLGLLPQLPQLWWFCGENMLAPRERRGIERGKSAKL